jgi:hypothetical protein
MRLGLAFKFGFKFPVGGSFPVILIESLANTPATATWSSTIALILKDKGECKLHGLN